MAASPLSVPCGLPGIRATVVSQQSLATQEMLVQVLLLREASSLMTAASRQNTRLCPSWCCMASVPARPAPSHVTGSHVLLTEGLLEGPRPVLQMDPLTPRLATHTAARWSACWETQSADKPVPEPGPSAVASVTGEQATYSCGSLFPVLRRLHLAGRAIGGSV